MNTYQPTYQQRLAQAAPAPAPMPPSPVAVPVPVTTVAPVPVNPMVGGFLDTLKWAAIGFAAGGVTGFALGKMGIGGKGPGADTTNGLIGGLGGLAASVLPKLLG